MKIFLLIIIFTISLIYLFGTAFSQSYYEFEDIKDINLDSAILTKVNNTTVKAVIPRPGNEINVTVEKVNNQILRVKRQKANLVNRVQELNNKITSLENFKSRIETTLTTQ